MKYLIIILFLPIEAVACWVHLSLETVVSESPVVIRGEVTDIVRAPAQLIPQDEVVYDVALIRVDEILKNSLGEQVKLGATVELKMPSVNNLVKWSTFLHYDMNQEGFWILEFKDGFFWATYPDDFQPLENKALLESAMRPRPSSGKRWRIH